MTYTQTTPQIQSGLPQLSAERIEQMIHLAASHAQETKKLPWYQTLSQRLKSPLQSTAKRRVTYGLGATALSAACLGAVLLVPTQTTQAPTASQLAGGTDVEITDMMMYELLDSLT